MHSGNPTSFSLRSTAVGKILIMWFKRFISPAVRRRTRSLSRPVADIIISPPSSFGLRSTRALSGEPWCFAIFQHADQYTGPSSRSPATIYCLKVMRGRYCRQRSGVRCGVSKCLRRQINHSTLLQQIYWTGMIFVPICFLRRDALLNVTATIQT